MSAVKTILNSNVRDIIKSPELVILILRTYSDLYVCGKQVSTCENSIINYYNQLKIDGMERENIAEKAKNRTLIPNFTGLKYIPQIAKHINSELLNDEEAIEYLKKGVLSESAFKKLPDGYKNNAEPEKKVSKKKNKN